MRDRASQYGTIAIAVVACAGVIACIWAFVGLWGAMSALEETLKR